MRRATGSKSLAATKKVSIQLALDGHSFSVSGVTAETVTPEGAPLEVEVLTPRTLLVPAALYREETAGAMLAAAGMPAAADDAIVRSEERDGVVAVMAAGREAIEAVRASVPAGVRFTTPLLEPLDGDVPAVRGRVTAGIAYIKIWNDGLRMAEAVPAATEEDLLCLFERLGEAFVLREYRLCLAGDESFRLRRLLKNRFKEIVCE